MAKTCTFVLSLHFNIKAYRAVGIRKKILLGFVAIGSILFLSGVVAIFEMTRLTDLISSLLTNNIQATTSANAIDRVTLRQSSRLLDVVKEEPNIKAEDFSGDTLTLREHVALISNNVTIEGEEVLAGRLRAEFEVYKAFLNSVPAVMELEREQRIAWYTAYLKSHMSLTEITTEITRLNQDALLENTVKLEGNYYRMIMPAIIAIIAGVFMIFFFNYFINTYIVNPIIQIKEGIRSFLSSRTRYSVSIKTKDELDELNEEVKDLAILLRKREKECSALQNENREA